MDLIQNTQRYCEIYSILLPIYTIAMAVKVMCKYFGRVSGCDSNPYSKPFFLIATVDFIFLI
jgi:hypothetical protein